MIIHDVEQGTPEWMALRCGRPTASMFGKILTATGKRSKSAAEYMAELCAQKLSGKVYGWGGNHHTDRGHELEPEARAYAEFVLDREIRKVGFVTSNDGAIGASPDGLLVEDAAGLEIKAKIDKIHFLILEKGTMPTEHIPQVQGSMLVTGYPVWLFLPYSLDLPSLLLPIERDDAYISLLDEALQEFCAKLDARLAALRERGIW